MKRVNLFLLLPFLAVACQDQGPMDPLDDEVTPVFAIDPDFCAAHPDHPKCQAEPEPDPDPEPDPGEITFVYPDALQSEMGSDCWYPEPGGDPGWGTLNPHGRDFRCAVDPAVYDESGMLVSYDLDPKILTFQVLSEDTPVTSGTVTVWRCEDLENGNQPVRWDLCGVRQKPPYNKRFQAVPYATVAVSGEGFSVSFTDRAVLYDGGLGDLRDNLGDDDPTYPNQPDELGWGGFRWVYENAGGGELSDGWFNIRPYPQGDPYYP
jgi:hypothetical protein